MEDNYPKKPKSPYIKYRSEWLDEDIRKNPNTDFNERMI